MRDSVCSGLDTPCIQTTVRVTSSSIEKTDSRRARYITPYAAIGRACELIKSPL